MPGVPPARYGYLGPEGTFTEAALLQVRAAQTGERLPYPSVDAALAAVREGEIAAAMVPIENSVEGGVGATLDALSVGEDVVVVREALVITPGVVEKHVANIFAKLGLPPSDSDNRRVLAVLRHVSG